MMDKDLPDVAWIDWPYCDVAKRFVSVVTTSTDMSSYDTLTFRRRIETIGATDTTGTAAGPRGERDGVCQLGELTNEGRSTTLALGQRLRRLYVDQLGFLPATISSTDDIYLRASPIQRALDSVQQAFTGLYPAGTRAPGMANPIIFQRTKDDETLFPNEASCKRYKQLIDAFRQRCADRWNQSTDMDYLNSRIGKYMPAKSPQVLVDSHPRLSGILDTVNSTRAHGPDTRLPAEFYEEKVLAIIDKISVEEWFEGYKQNQEMRKLGIGALAGDITEKMVAHAETVGPPGVDRKHAADGQPLRIGLSGCHDTTLAPLLASFGAYDDEPWPPYTSHLAFELLRKVSTTPPPPSPGITRTWWSSFFGAATASSPSAASILSSGGAARIGRRSASSLSEAERARLQGYYVRIRYNDRVMRVAGCRAPGKHLEGDESLCTLEEFKRIADRITPADWKRECAMVVEGGGELKIGQRAGYSHA